ncbi:DUF1292 domain-containing protein [Megasphaera paucivorans]|uniref:Uncharacterized protein n=1 Tax=Megasphaera paucivorans TaxID=349095 RepID=A0A1G9Y0X3_9FIRM|nr:DUF1292 domain-containing protein [Megasphaera paucivorans]SDN02722.1 Protein of unknown function [Megasphaera paucivorans]
MAEEMMEEVPVIVIEDEEGNEVYYHEETSLEYDGKKFSILVRYTEDENGEEAIPEDAETIIARVEMEDGEPLYVAPTDEEFEAVLQEYEKMFNEE